MFYLVALIYLLAVNAAAYMAFRADKRRATLGHWRIPEANLLALALLGGWCGARIGQRRFRHKTRKQPFATQLNFVPVVWVGILALGGFLASGNLPAVAILPGNLAAYRQSADPEPERATPRFFQGVSEREGHWLW